jgi:transposase
MTHNARLDRNLKILTQKANFQPFQDHTFEILDFYMHYGAIFDAERPHGSKLDVLLLQG